MMKKFYRGVSCAFSLMACIGGVLDEPVAVIAALCAIAYAVLSVGED